HNLPLNETRTPADQAELASVVRIACEHATPLYPLGGETALDYGLPGRSAGLGLSLAGLQRVVDYPARDMTVTVEAGITMADLAQRLAAEGQWLPIEAAEPQRATLGGVIATNASGPRRFGQGTIRDYVIGISAVDGRGTLFHGGGRVVKNVAGYDFCKLLTGSLGTLGVITQVTLKVKPRPRASVLVVGDVSDLVHAEKLLAALGQSRTTPTAVELLAGPHWDDHPQLGSVAPGSVARLVVGLEGTEAEVAWMVAELAREWRQLGVESSYALSPDATPPAWNSLTEFAAAREGPAVLKANLLPSAVTSFVELARRLDTQASIQAHAASGIVIVRLAGLSPSEIAGAVIKRLQPAATAARGSVVVLHAGPGVEITRQLIWGPARSDLPQMLSVKQQFDPRGILNPGRFIFPVL
ncbi:MAG: FAD-binding oxidoreductase, partial [Planctomycetaceae bacterium]|nr:FAD-binding oxidoreductase [Planctomycetaceae bacterium]